MASTVTPPVLALYMASDNTLWLENLAEGRTGTIITAASSITITLRDSGNAEVSGVTWPLTFATAGGGEYYVNLPDTMVLTENAEYVAEVIADDGPGRKTTWYKGMKAEKQP
jgi:hypothetical protein